VKLGDFGTATRIVPGKLLKYKIGTPAYMAPEMHLLPGRSPGYDHKVDVWAAGVVMIFLLAIEHPFMDGEGRMLRHRLISGEVPLWETGSFEDLLIGFQEAVGMGRKRPSRLARDLVLHLLTPARENRGTADSILRHQWFKAPVPLGVRQTNENDTTGIALLEWKDFEDGLAAVGRDLQWTMAMMTGSAAPPNDDPLKTCVVCKSGARGFGHTCPQCKHAVCDQCLEQLPKTACPYCRRETLDLLPEMVFKTPQERSNWGKKLVVASCANSETCRPTGMNVRHDGPVVTC